MTNITKLKNGITVITDERNFKKVSMGVYVKAGLKNETAETNGISHFLEHMAFKGTKTRTQLELSEMIEAIGGNMNAHTSSNHTFYKTSLLPEHWKTGVDFLADIVQNSVFPEIEIEKERNVILQEISRYQDMPTAVLFEKFSELAYAGSPLSRSILGPEDNIRNFKRDDFVNYVNAHYIGENMYFTICGDIKHDEVVAYVEEMFAGTEAGVAQDVVDCKFQPVTSAQTGKFGQTHMLVAFEGPALRDEEGYVATVFSTILDGGMSCRLFQEVREKHGLAYTVGFGNEAERETGYMYVYCGIETADLEKAQKVCIETVETMLTHISDADFEKAKNILKYQVNCSYDNCSGITFGNVSSLVNRGRIDDFETITAELNKITKQDVFDFAKKYLKGEYSCVALLGNPEAQENEA